MLDTLLLLHPVLDNSWINFDVGALVQNFWSATFDGLTFGAIYGLIAVGYTLVYGVLNLINFAHSEVFIVGAYGVVFTLTSLGFGPRAPTSRPGRHHRRPPSGAPRRHGGVRLRGLRCWSGRVPAAAKTERATPRVPHHGDRRIVHDPVPDLPDPGANAEPAVTMFIPKPVFDVFGTIVNSQQIIIVVASVLLMVATDYFIRRTRTGRGIRAVAQDPDTATLMGVNKERIISITFMVGGILAGAAALFYVMLVPSGVIYNGGFILGVKAFAAAVLGGIGNVRGALLGGLLLGVIGNYGQILLGDSQWTDVVAFVVLVLVLLVKPTGILGTSLGRSRA